MSIKIIPVIHVTNFIQTFNQVVFAKILGCHGAILIDMGYADLDTDLHDMAMRIKTDLGDVEGTFKIGVNLGHSILHQLENATGGLLDMYWTDLSIPDAHVQKIKLLAPHIEVYESFDFKYQPKNYSIPLDQQAKNIIDRGFIPTTSGRGTGIACDISKMDKIGKVDKLALASGISSENLAQYSPYITHALVNSSIM